MADFWVEKCIQPFFDYLCKTNKMEQEMIGFRKRNHWFAALASILFLFFNLNAYGQTETAGPTRIWGNITDQDGEPAPYVSIRIDGTSTGCISDNKGNFSFTVKNGNGILIASAIGFSENRQVIDNATRYPLKITLQSETYDLGEVVIKPQRERYSRRNNPAVDLIRDIISKKDGIDPYNSEYVSRKRYESLQVALDGFDQEMQQQPPYRGFPFLSEFTDTSEVSGKPVLTISSREVVGTDYFRKKPHSEKQYIEGVNWVGIEDFLPDTEVRAYIEATLHDIDLFNDKVMVFHREFVSPFSTLATSFYQFHIMDSLMVDGEECIDLAFVPANPQSLGFTGHIFATSDSTHFVKWIQMNIPYDINLNFVEYMNAEQRFSKGADGTRILDYECITAGFDFFNQINGLFARREVSYSGYLMGDDVRKDYFSHPEPIIYSEDSSDRSMDYWDGVRLANNSVANSEHVRNMVEKLRQTPTYRWAERIISLMFSGYVPVGNEKSPYFYYGPLNTTLSHNGLEGFRVRAGGMTTARLSKHLLGMGYIAYGFGDDRFKYKGRLEYSFRPKKEFMNEFPIHSLRLEVTEDRYQYGQQYLFTQQDNMLLSVKRQADNMIGYFRNAEFTYTKETYGGLSFSAIVRRRFNEPSRFITMVRNDGSGQHAYGIMQGEFEIGIRYAPGEKFSQHKWDRQSRTPEKPVFTLNHSFSEKDLLGSDYSIQHTEFSYRQRLLAAPFGHFDVVLKAGKIWGQAPYPLLIIPNANLSYTYRKESFETLSPMEFLFDQHVTWDVTWRTGGFIANRVPAVKHMSLRESLYCRGIWGSLDDRNNPEIDNSGKIFLYPTTFSRSVGTEMGRTPFVEVGAGIDNIFKLLSVSYFQRLTYKNTPEVTLRGIRICVELDY